MAPLKMRQAMVAKRLVTPTPPTMSRSQWNAKHPGETAGENAQSYARLEAGQPTGFPGKGRSRVSKAMRRKAVRGTYAPKVGAGKITGPGKMVPPAFYKQPPGVNVIPGGITPPDLIKKGIRYS